MSPLTLFVILFTVDVDAADQTLKVLSLTCIIGGIYDPQSNHFTFNFMPVQLSDRKRKHLFRTKFD